MRVTRRQLLSRPNPSHATAGVKRLAGHESWRYYRLPLTSTPAAGHPQEAAEAKSSLLSNPSLLDESFLGITSKRKDMSRLEGQDGVKHHA